jgi:hypothetical protein
MRTIFLMLFLLSATSYIFSGSSLPAPDPVYPLNGDTLQVNPGHKLMIKWNAVAGADRYVLIVESKDSPGAAWQTYFKKEVGRITGYGFVFPSVKYGRWRVWALAKDGSGGDKCPWQEFKFR